MLPPNPPSWLSSFVVIPARVGSTRLERKMLLAETGKSLVQHTYEAAAQARRPHGVCIATDSLEIATEARRFGGTVMMTSPDLASGTDRVAQVAREYLGDMDIIVNVQGDEPEVAPEAIDHLVALMQQRPDVPMATLAAPLRRRCQLDDPACVKVVFDAAGRAMYFSRSAIPHARRWDDGLLSAEPPVYYQHLGLYAYRRDFLLRLATLPPSPLEQLESLEQLRVLDQGYPILVGVTQHASSGIDTPADYQAFVDRHRRAG